MRVRRLFLAVPTALVAAAGFAWLTSAAASNGGFNEAPQIAQAAPPVAPPPATGGGPVPGGGPERMMREFSPKAFCEDRIARRIGNRAYLKARLDLKADQVPAWDAFQKAADEASAKEKAKCASLPAEMKTPPSFPDRLGRREEMMKSPAREHPGGEADLDGALRQAVARAEGSVRPTDDGPPPWRPRPASPAW